MVANCSIHVISEVQIKLLQVPKKITDFMKHNFEYSEQTFIWVT